MNDIDAEDPRVWIENLDEVLIFDEGMRLRPYLDSQKNWTIGVGYLIGERLEDLEITADLARYMLAERRDHAIQDVIKIFGIEKFNAWAEARRVAVVSMMYTMGITRFKTFINMIAAIDRNDWLTASHSAKHSKWARDVDPKQREGVGRDDRIAFMMKEGKYDPAYSLIVT